MRQRITDFVALTIGIGLVALVFSGCWTLPPAEPEKEEEIDVFTLMTEGKTDEAREYFLGKIDINARDSLGRTPLHIAAEQRQSEMAAFLLARGAAVDAVDNRGRTPLNISADIFDVTTTQVLVNGGANIHRPQPDGITPAMRAIDSSVDGFLFAMLTPSSLPATDDAGKTVLHLAADAGKPLGVNMILRAGDTVHRQDREGKTALDLALAHPESRSHAEAAELLIQAGAVSTNPFYSYLAPAVRNSNYTIRAIDGGSALHYAAQMGAIGFIELILDRKGDVNSKDGSGTTPLHEAARAGNLRSMELLISRGAQVNLQDANGNTPLHIVMPPSMHREGITLLLSHGANPNLRDVHGDSPLHIAVALNRNATIVRSLLEGGADVNLHNIEGKTPLYVAVQENRVALIPLLLHYRADIFAADNLNITPYERALRNRNSDVLYALITEETTQQSDSAGNTLLHLTVRNDEYLRITTLLLDRRSSINARNREGDTSLHLAIRHNTAETGKLLLVRGADIFAPNARGESPLYLTFHSPGGVREWVLIPEALNARDGQGNTALHYAAQWRLDAHIPLIVARGASTEAGNSMGEPPLFSAIKVNASSTVRTLLSAGAAVDSRDSLGNNGLHAAVRWNAPNTAEVLLLSGIDVNAHAFSGKTPLHDAIRLGSSDVEWVLILYGANLAERDAEGNSPLMEAVITGRPLSVEELLKRGADPTVRNGRGETPLHIAVIMERSDLVALLLRPEVSIHAKNALGETPFTLALGSSARMVSTLLTPDRIQTSDDDGQAPIHIALLKRAPLDMMRLIIQLGGRVSAQDNAGRTPLRLAVDLDSWDGVKLLADLGSDPFSAAGDGRNSGELAIGKGQTAVRALFSGRAIGAKDPAGNTILHYAARTATVPIINLLIELGANKNVKNVSAESPADIARRWNREDIARLLN